MKKVSALVSTGWLAHQLLSSSKGSLCALDASWHLPRTNRNAFKEFEAAHIQGASFFDISTCAKTSHNDHSFSHILPNPDFFSEFVSNLGISNETHVVIYENNAQFGIFSGPRAWWMFRVFGHDKVSIMDGGLPLWVKEGRLTTCAVSPPKKASFTASFRPELFKSFSDIVANLEEEEKFQVVDARTENRFKGIKAEPREGIKSGNIPNSINIPFPTLVEERDGVMKLKSPEQLKDILKNGGFDLSRPNVTTCGSGVTACVLALGAYLAGKEDVAVFDGSWEEYYTRMKDLRPENIRKG